ncbi:MAG: Gfo/Idh/MocA family oxidoreductase, partial [Roseomonas sp.]|nr:Gfo/Idh/MocA family oxidoreductase [Roseomonas sp.]
MIEAAIVGMGRWGQTLVDSVQNRNDAGIRFIAGSTGRPERAAEWAARQGVKIMPDLNAILAEPRVKAVVIASPHQMHAEQVIAAARAGKHVFVEKPFTMTKASAEAAVSACRQAGVVMALGHNRRFLP